MSRRRIASRVLLFAALGLAAVFWATRGPVRATALAVYAMPGPAGDPPGVLLLESFDLVAHRSVPVRVEEVVGRGPAGDRAIDFEQEGERPAVVRVHLPRPAPEALLLRARNDLGILEGEVTGRGFPDRPGSPGADLRALGWPVVVRCADRNVVLLSETGVPEVGNRGRVLALVGPPPAGSGEPDTPGTVALRLGIAETSAALEAWGGTVLEVEPRVGRIMARLALRWPDRACESTFLMTAASRRTRVREVTVGPGATGRLRMDAVVTAPPGGEMFTLLARWDPDRGPGPLVDARVFEVRDGPVRVAMDLPGPGVYQVRFTGEPLQTGPSARGADVIVAVEPTGFPEGRIAPILSDVPPGEARERARPFALATLAAASPIALTQVANTAARVRSATERSRSRRDAWLLAALAACLVGLVVLMGAEVVAGHRRDRRRFAEQDHGLDAGVGPLHAGRGLLMAAGVAAILLAAVTALILVLKTL